MTGKPLPLALLATFGVAGSYLVVDPAANDAYHLLDLDPTRYFLQMRVVCSEMMPDIIDGDPFQESGITLRIRLLVVMPMLPE